MFVCLLLQILNYSGIKTTEVGFSLKRQKQSTGGVACPMATVPYDAQVHYRVPQ